jgi:hypothetical protein
MIYQNCQKSQIITKPLRVIETKISEANWNMYNQNSLMNICEIEGKC